MAHIGGEIPAAMRVQNMLLSHGVNQLDHVVGETLIVAPDLPVTDAHRPTQDIDGMKEVDYCSHGSFSLAVSNPQS